VGTRDYRLEVALAVGADLAWNVQDASSPYYAPDLAQAIRDANDGALADRVLVATASVSANQQAVEISGNRSVVVLMGLAGPNDAISVPLLSNLYQDKTIRFSILYPLQWPKTIRLLESRKVDTSKIITHSATLDGIAPAIERVLNREDHVVKTVIQP
jgi:threonine dehydrogenase-like Zn-dependent dehydrogenase